MKHASIAALSLVALGACQQQGPAYDYATHPLVGPGGTTVDQDPCPEGPDADATCAKLVTARRISWFGYLARWMRVMRAFEVPSAQAGGYATYPGDALELGLSHPDRALVPLVEQASSRSQYVVLHEVLGEPADALGVEETTVASFRAQHATLITAAAVKQACRVSSSLAQRLANHLASTTASEAALRAIDGFLVADHGSGASAVQTIRGFKPAFGYLAFGRQLNPQEIAALDAALGAGGSARSTQFATFRVALTGLMCSTMSLVE